MSIDTRLRESAEEAHRVAAGFSRPEITSPARNNRSVVVATAGLVILAVIAAIWGGSVIRHEDREIADQPDPELQWHPIEHLPDIDMVRDVWADQNGFHIWSGTEIWSSGDGVEWGHTVTTPSNLGLFVDNAMTNFDGAWFALIQSEPSVLRHNGTDWESNTLPVDVPNDNLLLTNRVQPFAITHSREGLVVAGGAYVFPDPDRVMGAVAPELAAAGATAEYDPNAQAVEIRDVNGALQQSIPAADIDARLTDYPYLIYTLVWYSSDGVTWHDVVVEDGGTPIALETIGDGFVLITSTIQPSTQRVWWSQDGATWQPYAELRALEITRTTVFHDTLIARNLGDELAQIAFGQNPVPVSTFPTLDPGHSLGEISAGDLGVLVDVYDSSTSSTRVVAVVFSPDTERWVSYHLEEVLGGTGTIRSAVGDDRIVTVFEPGGEAYSEITAPFEVWVATSP